MNSKDYYRTMEIDRKASGDEIKNAYRKLAKRFHPDVSNDPDGERKFKAVAEAYQTLKHPKLRAAYDGQTPFCRVDDEHVLTASFTLQSWLAFFVSPNWGRVWAYWAVS